MKIRSITLTNFRRFIGTTSVEGIGDGVSVLVGRNEIGKSTLLQAINGVVFEKAKSTSQHVKSFRHTTNGTVPEVEMAFEIENQNWSIRKRFAGQAGKAVLLSAAGRRFEDEAAEVELQRLLGVNGGRGSAEPGIWGTLWVQQGHSFGHPDLDEQARRTLQSCLEAQVGAVTGGIRGHRIPEAIDAALSELVSSRGPRGVYKASHDALAEAIARGAELTIRRADLFKQMDELARLKRELRDRLSDWDDTDHNRELGEERAKATAAATKASEIQAAQIAVKLAEQNAVNSRNAVTERDRLVKELTEVDGKAATASNDLLAAETTRATAFSAAETAEQKLTLIRSEAREIGERSRRLERVRGVRLLKTQIATYRATIDRAASLEQESQQLAVEIGKISANAPAVRRIEEATANLSAAQAKINAVATTISFEIDKPGLVRFDGEPLSDTATTRAVTASSVIEIHGVGKISVAPQIMNRAAMTKQLEEAQDELKAALEAAGASDLVAARRAAAQRQQLEGRALDIRRELNGLAPGDPAVKLGTGLDALRTRAAEASGRLETELTSLNLGELPETDEVDQMIGNAHSDSERISGEIERAETALSGLKATLSQHDTAVQTLRQNNAILSGRRDGAAATLFASRAGLDDEALRSRSIALGEDLAKQQTILLKLEKDRGEVLEAINARIKRLEGAAKGQSDSVSRLNQDIARLAAFIEANEGSGIEESLEAAKAEHLRLQTVVDDYEQEADVLKLLLGTLRAAESEAKTRYLTPVLARVEPYLKMLLPESEIVLDENLGISALMRDGGREEFSSLSGGTQEQIAVLARLAFAELLLGRGRPATIILDDALAFSDDDRIERMFDVLMRAGENVQIIVLTCRKRLFTRLGAKTLQLREVLN